MRYVLFIFIFFFFFSYAAYSQVKETPVRNNCDMVVRDANRLFEDGNYENCVSQLESALKSCNLLRNDKEKAMELLAKAYIEAGDPGKAESTINIMLINYPHYELKEADNSEVFNRLINKFKIHPRFSLGIKNTGNYLLYKTTGIISVSDGLSYNEPYSAKGYGFMYYGWSELEFDKDVSINAELIWRTTRYDRYMHRDPGFNLSFWEYDQYIQIPFYFKKYYHLGQNVLSYGSAGLNMLYMTRALGNVSISYTKDDVITGKNEDHSAGMYNINLLEQRNRITWQFIIAGGVGYKIKNLRMFLDVRYFKGLQSFTNPAKSLLNTTLLTDFYYVDNSVKLNEFELGASISYTLFNSVKRVR